MGIILALLSPALILAIRKNLQVIQPGVEGEDVAEPRGWEEGGNPPFPVERVFHWYQVGTALPP
jgi:hypothetical protein